MKEGPLPNSPFYVVVEQVLDYGQKIGRNML